MVNAQIYSADLAHKKACSFEEANRLLGLGHARIVKFYPFSVQMKSADPNRDNDDLMPIKHPTDPTIIPMKQTKKRQKVEMENEVAYLF